MSKLIQIALVLGIGCHGRMPVWMEYAALADRFQLLHLSLFDRHANQPLLAFDDAKDLTREDHLRVVFGRTWEFEYRGNVYYYVPAASDTSPVATVGLLGRRFEQAENLAPEEGFAVTEHTGWKAVVVLVDPRDRPDGQKVAINVDRQVGTPFPLFTRFTQHVNATLVGARFHMEVEPLFDDASFWRFANAHKGNVTSVTFEFATPNMIFGAYDDFESNLRQIRQEIQAQRVDFSLKSEDGLDLHSPRVQKAVAYAGRGTGTVKARARDGHRYDSLNNTRMVVMPVPPRTTTTLLERAVRHLRTILGL